MANTREKRARRSSKDLGLCPYLEDCTTRLEKMSSSLMGRENHLKDKITMMERSMPALIAHSMQMLMKNCANVPNCTSRQFIQQLVSGCNGTEKILQELKDQIQSILAELTELHNKIISTDIELEESKMRLCSLEMMNQEMDDVMMKLQKELDEDRKLSVSSIHSEDVVCISKIRQLAKEELDLKHNIEDLERKEFYFYDQINRLLMSQNAQSACKHKKKEKCQRKKLPCRGLIVNLPDFFIILQILLLVRYKYYFFTSKALQSSCTGKCKEFEEDGLSRFNRLHFKHKKEDRRCMQCSCSHSKSPQIMDSDENSCDLCCCESEYDDMN
ncbi:uncharacterized protein [Prorops nasuta]|uniref:uncharacterized protein n=1 Tax=Prorops nasuta TaxID=863751 RepID=UPI0034CF379F